MCSDQTTDQQLARDIGTAIRLLHADPVADVTCRTAYTSVRCGYCAGGAGRSN